MDEQRLNAFIVARGLIDRGTSSADGTAPGAVAAVVMYDLAVETAAKATRAAYPVGTHPGTGYATKPGELTKAPPQDPSLGRVLDDVLAAHRERAGDAQVDLDGRQGALALHRFRNGVQHEGNVPSADDVDRARLRATDFLESLLQTFFGTRLLGVSRAALLREPGVRERVEQAEEAAAQLGMDDAMQHLTVAFELSRSAFRATEPHRRRSDVRRTEIRRSLSQLVSPPKVSSILVGRVTDAFKRVGLQQSQAKEVTQALFGAKPADASALEKVLEQLAARLDRLDERMEALSVAGDPGEYAWFRQLVPPAVGTLDGEWISYPPRRPVTQGDYRRAVDFVVSTALRWQQLPAPERDEDEADDVVRLGAVDVALP